MFFLIRTLIWSLIVWPLCVWPVSTEYAPPVSLQSYYDSDDAQMAVLRRQLFTLKEKLANLPSASKHKLKLREQLMLVEEDMEQRAKELMNQDQRKAGIQTTSKASQARVAQTN